MNDQSRQDNREQEAREWRDEFNSPAPSGEYDGTTAGAQTNAAADSVTGGPGIAADISASDQGQKAEASSPREHSASEDRIAAASAEAADIQSGQPPVDTPSPHNVEPAGAVLSGTELPPENGNAAPRKTESAKASPETAAPAGSKKRKKAKNPAASRLDPGPAEKCFNALSWAGLPVLLILTALVVFQNILVPRALWIPDEVVIADVYAQFLTGAQVALVHNGLPYTEMPPLYFWFLRGLDLIPRVDPPMLFFLGTALSAMLYVGSIWLLARATGHDRRTALASGLLALGTFFFMGMSQSVNADMLFAALMTLSLICFYRGWIKQRAPFWLTLAFLLAALATLVKGPLALAVPLIASILFLIWRATPGRLNGRDGLIGFLLMILLIAAWFVILYAGGHADYIVDIFRHQLKERIYGVALLPWWFSIVALLLICLPWTPLPLFVNWWAALRGLPALWRTRRENGGSAWLWLCLIVGLVLLSVISAKSVPALLPLMAPLAVLAGRSLLRLTPLRSRLYFFLLALLFFLLGLLLVLAHYHTAILPLLPADWLARLNGLLPPFVFAWLESARNLVCMGGVLIILALLLIFFCRRSLPGGTLLLCTLGLLVTNLPFALHVAPSMENVFSSRPLAQLMTPLIRDGYRIAACDLAPGAFVYYLNELAQAQSSPEENAPSPLNVPDFSDVARLETLLAEQDRVLVLMPEQDWSQWQSRPASLEVMKQQWLGNELCVLARQDARPESGSGPEAAPAAQDTPAQPEAAAQSAEQAAPPAEGQTVEQPEAQAPAQSAPAEEAAQQDAPDAGTDKADAPAPANPAAQTPSASPAASPESPEQGAEAPESSPLPAAESTPAQPEAAAQSAEQAAPPAEGQTVEQPEAQAPAQSAPAEEAAQQDAPDAGTDKADAPAPANPAAQTPSASPAASPESPEQGAEAPESSPLPAAESTPAQPEAAAQSTEQTAPPAEEQAVEQPEAQAPAQTPAVNAQLSRN